jgi:hypothetical protein
VHDCAAEVLRNPGHRDKDKDKEVRVEWGVSTRTYALSLPLSRRWGRRPACYRWQRSCRRLFNTHRDRLTRDLGHKFRKGTYVWGMRLAPVERCNVTHRGK